MRCHLDSILCVWTHIRQKSILRCSVEILNHHIVMQLVAMCVKAWGHQLRKQGWFKLWVYCFSLAAVVVVGWRAPSTATQLGDDGESGNQIINDSVYPLEICSHCVSCHHSLPRISCSYLQLADKYNTSTGRAETRKNILFEGPRQKSRNNCLIDWKLLTENVRAKVCKSIRNPIVAAEVRGVPGWAGRCPAAVLGVIIFMSQLSSLI